ncbi:MAG TPA: triphosphoribosyl-dephospho-CoA synthase [Gemmataceae bacterium]|jgi:triphosphoribosyl-dephospho-CoA synthase|nr:triphosphoribosyl-dephospho-CoA synthase [Gemmataceae bacterium]
MPETQPPSIGLCAQIACILDVVSFKPGNVNLVFFGGDLRAFDLLASAAAIAPVLEQAPLRRVGDTILECVRETRKVTATNTNLGIVLLLAPLATVQPHVDIRGGLMRVLIRLDVADARAAYQAIRLAQPGGLGSVPEQDVSGEPTVSLREAMALAADRDLVARQYVNDFEQVFEGAEMLRELVTPKDTELETAVTRLYLQLLAKYTDSLIERKFGRPIAEEVSRRAREIVQSSAGYAESALTSLDSFLRAGPVMLANPGTTADLVTASLFVALRKGIIQLPLTRSASRRG